jgi:hypothetical protein
MDWHALSNNDHSTVWLANLIETTEALASSNERCDPAIVMAFSHRLEMRGDVRPGFDWEGPTRIHAAHGQKST